MHDEFECCEYCSTMVEAKNKTSAKLWQSLCKYPHTDFFMILNNSKNKEIQILEHLGLIITTDVEVGVILKLQANVYGDFGSFKLYCGGECEHEEDL